MLKIQTLSAGYPKQSVLQGISLSVPKGKITAVLGPNGCGKSTLLKVIAGILPTAEGKVIWDGTDLATYPPQERAKLIAFLPQNRQIPETTVEQLVLHGRFPYLHYPRRYRKEDLEIAEQAMRHMGIEDLAHRNLLTLSGGQLQKVYIAMALAQDTQVVLMDEPTTFLDVSHQLHMMEQARFLADIGKTVVLVLHDLSMALKYADHLAVLVDGTLLIEGDAETVFHSKTLDTAFGVQVLRTSSADGWQYYCKEGD